MPMHMQSADAVASCVSCVKITSNSMRSYIDFNHNIIYYIDLIKHFIANLWVDFRHNIEVTIGITIEVLLFSTKYRVSVNRVNRNC